MPVILIHSERFAEHQTPPGHPERPERLAAARRAAERVTARVGRVDVAARPATDDELGRVHHADYVERLGQKAGSWSTWDEDTYAAPGSSNASRRAAGGAVELVNALLDGKAERGVALLRPPGRAPIVVAAYCDAPKLADAEREAVLKAVGAAVSAMPA